MTTNTKQSLEIDAFLEKMECQKRFSLTSESVVRKIRMASIFTLITISAFLFLVIIGNTITFPRVIIYLLITASIWSSLFLGAKYFHTACIKGESLILTDFSSKSTVTSVNSVKDVKSYRILGFQFTRLKYVLDGKSHLICVTGSRMGSTIPVDYFILQAKMWSKKKKANRKPGSVLA